MVYGLFVLLAFWYFVIRIWIVKSRRMALTFVCLWLVAVFGFPRMQLPTLATPLTVIFLTIVLILIDRYESTKAGL